jgi:enamine deaminase RidA (YjgF/YER057c/UK114 family)
MTLYIEGAGASFEDIVQIIVLVANPKDMEAMEKTYQDYCKDRLIVKTVIVTPLSSEDMFVQMRCTAYHPLNPN